jgi:poly-gamma-glutamate capsule biosynthesis protein CapA/YwtB (metallophosphatase superfamily)
MADQILLAVGDVAARRDDLASMFTHVAPTLRGGDFVFGQLEAPLSDRGSPSPDAKLAMRAPPALARTAADAGFNLMSAAGNHCLDFGPDALADTLSHGTAAGLALSGAGANLAEARAPAILERGGVRLAVVAASSILPAGYAAQADRPGCAPLRAFTHYEPIEHDQPGTPPRIHTFPHPGDLARLCEDIAAAKAGADIVALSIHWGIHLIPAEIADYQREAAFAAIEAGADIVLGHHPHILKGVEFHRGKAIFYSLGNFAIEQPQAFDPAIMASASFKQLMALNPHFEVERAYVLPPETRNTMIARAVIRDGAIADVGFLPAYIEDDSAPVLPSPDDPRFAGVVDYMRAISASQGLKINYEVDRDWVRITALRG